jgi:hypothetical protein
MADIGWQDRSAPQRARQEREQYEAAGERHQWEDQLAREAKEADYNGRRLSLVSRIVARLRRS